jgi:hypothetical protein
MGRLRGDLDYTSIDDVIQTGMHEFIDNLQQCLNQVSEAVHHDFFTLAQPQKTDDVTAPDAFSPQQSSQQQSNP